MSAGIETFPPEHFHPVEQQPNDLLTAANCRLDGRSGYEIRPQFLKAGLATQAKGSAYVEVGLTKVICSVYGPHEVTKSDASLEISSFGQIEVTVRFAPFATPTRLKRQRRDQASDEEVLLSQTVTDGLKPAILFHKFPKAQVDVSIVVLEDDGGVLAACITAASMALADAGVEMYDLVVGCHARIFKDFLLMDPSSSEEYRPTGLKKDDDCGNDGSVTVAVLPSINQFSVVYQQGVVKPDKLIEVLTLCNQHCMTMLPVLQDCVVKAFQQRLTVELSADSPVETLNNLHCRSDVNMVQLRPSLETLVATAWRESWTELDWSVNLKAILMEDDSDRHKLCGLLLKHATLSEVPNKLMFIYLSSAINSQAVSHSSVLEAVIHYTDFHREYCIEAILELVNAVRDSITADSTDNFRCRQLCGLLQQLFKWFLKGIQTALANRNPSLAGEFITALSSYAHNNFVGYCIYFDRLECPELYEQSSIEAQAMMRDITTMTWLPEMYRTDFRRSVERIEKIDLLIQSASVPKLRSARVLSSVVTVTAMYGSIKMSENLQNLVQVYRRLQRIELASWTVVLRDIIRAAFLLQLENSSHFQDSSVAAFSYLKIPRLLAELFKLDEFRSRDLCTALEEVATYSTLLNTMDVKNRCDSFQFFIQELQKLRLITDTDAAGLSGIRGPERTSLEVPTGSSQPNVSLVLKAEPTFQTLLKSFYSDFAKNKEKLVQMMHHMITGKSFDLICAAAAATSKLPLFSAKLIEFNESSQNHVSEEDNAMRNPIFDLSFLLLTKIYHLYGAKSIFDGRQAKGTFIEAWCQQMTAKGGKEVPSVDAQRLFEQLTSSDDLPPNSNWGEICLLLPAVGRLCLKGLRDGSVKQETLKHVFVKLQSEICSPLLGFGYWLSRCQTPERREEVRRLAEILTQHVEAQSASNVLEKQQHDRFLFMTAVLKRLLADAISPPSPPLVAYSWLTSTIPMPIPGVQSADLVKRTFQMGLRHGWLSGPSLLVLDKLFQDGDHKVWATVWLEELSRLTASEELLRGCEIIFASIFLDPMPCVKIFCRCFCKMIFRTGNEINCVAPRGQIFARLLVQIFMMGFQLHSDNNSLSPLRDTPTPSSDGFMENGDKRAKLLRLGDRDDVSQGATCGDSAVAADMEVDEDSLSSQLTELYGNLLEACQEGDLRPTVYFAASFLRCTTEQNRDEAKPLLTLLPSHLLNSVIRIDPKILPAATLMSLYDLSDAKQRAKALQSLCFLRQLKSV